MVLHGGRGVRRGHRRCEACVRLLLCVLRRRGLSAEGMRWPKVVTGALLHGRGLRTTRDEGASSAIILNKYYVK